MDCPSCGFKNRAGTLFCEDCAETLFDEDEIPTRKLQHLSRTGEAKKPIRLYVRGLQQPILLSRTLKRIIIGREDTTRQTEEKPDLDLTPYGAPEYGVSRMHATLDAHAHPPTLADMGSANGTYLNGQKLLPNQPRALRNGDEIRLGRLVARVDFR